MRSVMVVLVLILLTGCWHTRVCREREVYITEVNFMEQAALQPVATLEKFIKTDCKCKDGQFITLECEDAARLVLAVKTRVPWHKSMMLYNAGVDEVQPSTEPPVVPLPSTLCPQ